jgi:hypothetical protein
VARTKAASTVGELRALIKGLRDDTPVRPCWPRGHRPHKYDPGVELLGLRVQTDRRTARPYLAVVVKLYAVTD